MGLCTLADGLHRSFEECAEVVIAEGAIEHNHARHIGTVAGVEHHLAVFGHFLDGYCEVGILFFQCCFAQQFGLSVSFAVANLQFVVFFVEPASHYHHGDDTVAGADGRCCESARYTAGTHLHFVAGCGEQLQAGPSSGMGVLVELVGNVLGAVLCLSVIEALEVLIQQDALLDAAFVVPGSGQLHLVRCSTLHLLPLCSEAAGSHLGGRQCGGSGQLGQSLATVKGEADESVLLCNVLDGSSHELATVAVEVVELGSRTAGVGQLGVVGGAWPGIPRGVVV